MKTLVVAATHAEIAPLLTHYKLHGNDFITTPRFDVLITGAGIAATAFALGRRLNLNYQLVLNLGIAGSFDKDMPLGTVVNVVEDCFSELGAQSPGGFITIDELGFGKSRFNGMTLPALPHVTGITVNTVHGDAAGIAKIVNLLNPQTESMEGAAVFYCAQTAGLPCAQVRSISNHVEPRNRDAWEIGLAIKNLNNWAINYLN